MIDVHLKSCGRILQAQTQHVLSYVTSDLDFPEKCKVSVTQILADTLAEIH